MHLATGAGNTPEKTKLAQRYLSSCLVSTVAYFFVQYGSKDDAFTLQFVLKQYFGTHTLISHVHILSSKITHVHHG